MLTLHPDEECCQIQETLADFEDLAALRQAKAEEATASASSLEQVKSLLGVSAG